MAGILNSIIHPIKTVQHTISKEAIEYNKEQMATEQAEAEAARLCNTDRLVNENDVKAEILKLEYYKTIPGIKIHPELEDFLSNNQNIISNAKSNLENLKDSYTSEASSIQVQQKYLKEQKKTIVGYKKSLKEAKKDKENEVSPIEYFFNLGKAKSIKQAIRTARENLTKARGKRIALELKIAGMQEKQKNIINKINEEKNKITKAGQQLSIYRSMTKKQFEIADKYQAVGAIAKHTGITNGTNKINKKLLLSLPSQDAKNLLRVLSTFPLDNPPQDMIISFSGNGLTERPVQTVTDVELATNALEKLNLKFYNGQLLPENADKGVDLLSSVNNIIQDKQNNYIDRKMIANDGKIITQSELNERRKNRLQRQKNLDDERGIG